MSPRLSLILSLFLAAIGADATKNAPGSTLLRAHNHAEAAVDTSSRGSLDIPDLAESRRRRTALNLQLVDNEDSSSSSSVTATATVSISTQCLNTLAAAADESGKLGTENYFVYTDGMSNGYFTTNGMTDYSSLPQENKFTFVTLSCQCIANGGLNNCCQGENAKIDVGGIDAESPESMSEELQSYVSDICSSTLEAIGEENILPPTGEEDPESEEGDDEDEEETAPTTTTTAEGEETTSASSASSTSTSGLTSGAWAGIGLASAATLALMGYYAFGR